MNRLIEWFLGCSHRRLTFPLTPRNPKTNITKPTYVVCLDCGKEFAYSWADMRSGDPLKQPEEPAKALQEQTA